MHDDLHSQFKVLDILLEQSLLFKRRTALHAAVELDKILAATTLQTNSASHRDAMQVVFWMQQVLSSSTSAELSGLSAAERLLATFSGKQLG